MTQTEERPQTNAVDAPSPNPATKRRALVTGASSGIGEEFARQLARKGYDLVLVARRRDRLEKLAADLSQAHGTISEVIEADLATTESVISVEKRLGQGDIDLVVNNAGFPTHGEFAALPIYRELEEVDVNIKALVRLTHAALGPMVQRKRGNVINVGSTGSFQPVPIHVHVRRHEGVRAPLLGGRARGGEEARCHRHLPLPRLRDDGVPAGGWS